MRLAGLAALVFVGSAMAQPATEPGAAAPAETAPPPVEPSVELGVRREVALTIPEMVERARVVLPGMERTAGVVRRMLSEARQKRDVVRVLCLNDKLNQIDLAIRTANDRVAVLDAAAAQNNLDQAKHETTVIDVLKDRVDALLTEANQCIGEEAGFIGDTTLTYTVDPRIPDRTEFTWFPDSELVSQTPIISTPILGRLVTDD